MNTRDEDIPLANRCASQVPPSPVFLLLLFLVLFQTPNIPKIQALDRCSGGRVADGYVCIPFTHRAEYLIVASTAMDLIVSKKDGKEYILEVNSSAIGAYSGWKLV